MEELLDRLCALAARLPRATVREMADILRQATDPAQQGADVRSAMQLLHAENRPLLQRLVVAWEQDVPKLTGGEVALALEAAARQEEAIAGRAAIELVWTGPAAPNAGLRGTEQVLLELISSAKESIYLVTFAAYKVPSLVAALQAAAARAVRIVFVLEDKEESAGKVTVSPLSALGTIDPEFTRIYIWPIEARPRNEKGQYGSLHAKFVIADGDRLFVSSANLTEFAMNFNMEMGVLIKGGPIPRQSLETVQALILGGHLRELSPP